MGFGALRSIIRPVSRALSSSSSSTRPAFTFPSPAVFRRNLPCFHSLTDTRYPKRRPSLTSRRKRSSLKSPTAIQATGPFTLAKYVPAQPVQPNNPNQRSVKRRNQLKRIKLQKAFIMSEKRKRTVLIQEAKRKKLAKRVERKMAAVARDRAWAERLQELQRLEEEKKKATIA